MTSKALPSSDLKIDDNRTQGVSVDTAEAAEATEAEGLGASKVCEPTGRPRIVAECDILLVADICCLMSFKFPGFVSKLVDKGDVTDSYVDVHLGKARLVRTKVIDNNLNPKFNEHFREETILHEPRELSEPHDHLNLPFNLPWICLFSKSMQRETYNSTRTFLKMILRLHTHMQTPSLLVLSPTRTYYSTRTFPKVILCSHETSEQVLRGSRI